MKKHRRIDSDFVEAFADRLVVRSVAGLASVGLVAGLDDRHSWAAGLAGFGDLDFAGYAVSGVRGLMRWRFVGDDLGSVVSVA